jgi:uncharacterized protein YciI
MKYFVVEVTYLVPIEKILTVRSEHRAYLQKGYAGNMLLMSGAQSSGKGGVVIARAKSLSALESFFKKDPYQVQHLASYRFIQFEPAASQEFMKRWLE